MLSKGFYLGSIIVGYVATFVLSFMAGVIAAMEGLSPWNASGAGLMLLAVVAGIYITVILLVLWWKAWKSIQEYGSRTTPGMAIGFLFIPFYNLYWVFQAFWGFAKDYNSDIDSHTLSIPRLPEGLFLGYTIVMLLTAVLFWIPFLNLLLSLGNMILTILVVNKLVNAVNSIHGAPLPERRGLVY